MTLKTYEFPTDSAEKEETKCFLMSVVYGHMIININIIINQELFSLTFNSPENSLL